MGNREKIYTLLTKHFSAAAACGIMGNIQIESNYRTTAIGDNGTSYGLCQWHNSRWSALKKYAEENGQAVDNVETQIAFMLHEMKTHYKSVYAACAKAGNTSDDAYNVAYTMCLKYEIPANAKANGERRGKVARELFSAFTSAAPAAGESVSMNTLRMGDRGTQVLVLQWLLNHVGYNAGPADGIFGDKTHAAVKAYQKAKNLTVDGVVGKNTWAELLK